MSVAAAFRYAFGAVKRGLTEPYASSSSSDKQDKSTFPMTSPAAAMHRNPSTGDRVVTSEEQCEGLRGQKGRICTRESNDVGKRDDFAHHVAAQHCEKVCPKD